MGNIGREDAHGILERVVPEEAEVHEGTPETGEVMAQTPAEVTQLEAALDAQPA